MFNTEIRINCSVDCIYIVWHAFNHIGQLLSADVTQAVGGILSAVLTQYFKAYFKCAYGVFAHISVSGGDYGTSPLFGDTRDHCRRQLPK